MKPDEWRSVLIGLLAVAAAAAFVYGPGLGLPFYSDDVYHLRWVETHDAAELLLPSGSFASYRPLPSLVWYLWRHTIGFYNPAGFYALNLLLHIANGWLVIALTRRLNAGTSPARRGWLPWAAGLVFVLYPFSYQAVLWVGALTHLLGAFLILLALLLYDRGRRGGWEWMVASWLAGLLAPFANEAGLTVAGLVLLYEWAAPRAGTQTTTRAITRATTRVAPTLAGPVLYLTVWLGWGARGPAGLLERLGQVEQLLQKATYFAQGATFPLQFAAARLADRWGWSVGQAVGWGAVISLAGLALCYARLGWRRLGMAWGWAALTMLPPLVALSAAYVDTAPRLLYIPSVGVACLWGWAAAGLAPVQRLGPALRAGALALILLPSLTFLRQRIRLFELVARPARQAVEASRSSPAESLLFVNLPAWAAYKENAFPVSTEGIAFLPGYAGMTDFIWANTSLDVDAQAVTFANIQHDQPYWYGSWGEARNWETLNRAIRDADRVYVALYGEEEIRLVEAGSVGGGAAAARPLARFDGGISLLDVQATPEQDGLTAVLVWSIEEHPEVGDTVFAQLFDAQGRLVGQADGLALANMFPFWLCQAGDVVRDVRWFPAPEGLPPGEYSLMVGMYDVGSGARRPVWENGGARFADDVVPALNFDVAR
ncbi:MAG: hypothetical protein U9R15_01915 [Chloroflexota bacterium]|nr:hypothetical protein [Chloroflexota bacterium]